MTDPAHEALKEIRDTLLNDHHERQKDFFRLSLAMPFAAFFFLLQLEQLYTTDSRSMSGMLNAAWIACLCSAVFGAGYLVLEMTLPLRMLGSVRIERLQEDQSVSEGGTGRIERIFLDQTKDTLGTFLYCGHLLSLLLLFVFTTIFKISNS